MMGRTLAIPIYKVYTTILCDTTADTEQDDDTLPYQDKCLYCMQDATYYTHVSVL